MQSKAVGNIYWFQLFPQAQSPNPDWISNFSALVFQGFGCISIEKGVESLSHQQKWAETTKHQFPFVNACLLRPCALLDFAVIALTSVDPTGSQAAVWNYPGYTCLHDSVHWIDLKHLWMMSSQFILTDRV